MRSPPEPGEGAVPHRRPGPLDFRHIFDRPVPDEDWNIFIYIRGTDHDWALLRTYFPMSLAEHWTPSVTRYVPDWHDFSVFEGRVYLNADGLPEFYGHPLCGIYKPDTPEMIKRRRLRGLWWWAIKRFS